MPLTLLPFVMLVIPLAEIAAFIVVGGQIGVWWTLALVLLTAIAGSLLLRIQGLGTLARIRSEIGAGRLPGRELVHGVMIVAAGVLLLTPGFVTDTMGLLLFVPAVRDAIWSFLRNRITMQTTGTGDARRPHDVDDPTIIDLDSEEYHQKGDGAPPRRR